MKNIQAKTSDICRGNDGSNHPACARWFLRGYR